MITVTHPSYDNINVGLKYIINQLDHQDYRPTLILGLARGGLIPAVIMSQSINIPMVGIYYSSKSGKGEHKYNNELPQVNDERLLIIDDIVDSGNSMKEVVEFYSKTNEVRSAALYAKDGSAMIPDFYWHPLVTDSPFIIFPWERNIKYLNL